ncbi:methionyl-tRNA formyltransferase [Janibacter sp. G56]|uniref:methionyl-tRNA formyltransferase n=1 Tax=Janibacter sp. G56 TaxID=3418717 RepID=UPI003CFE21DA
MRVVFAGTPEVAVPALEALLASPHEVVAVITRPDARSGRGRSLHASPVKERALAAGLEVLTPSSPKDPDFLARLRTIAPDACPVVAYGALLPPEALDIPTHGWINLHFSLLPAHRGAAPVQHALISGDDLTGASTFAIEAGLDTGPVYGVMTERVRATDTAGELLDRLAQGGAGLLVATLDGIADGSLAPVPQSTEGVSLAPKIGVDDARIDWSRPAQAIDRLVRGCTPAPGAWTTFRGERVKVAPLTTASADVLAAALPGSETTLAPGELAVTKRAVLVGTGSAALLLGLVRPHGKKEMPAPDWARGTRIAPGERFDDVTDEETTHG